jgi:hypothetical protein
VESVVSRLLRRVILDQMQTNLLTAGQMSVSLLLLSVLLTVRQFHRILTIQAFSTPDNPAGPFNALFTRQRDFSPLPMLGKNESFGACLMIKEDNNLLYEWLSYHYTTLPLRYLLIGSDLENKQDPRDVLERWGKANVGLHYWVLNASEFMFRHGTSKGMLDAHHSFVHRQRAFITTCTEFMKSKGLHWVAYIDSDEFITMNRLGTDETQPAFNDTLPAKKLLARNMRSALPPLHSNSTVLDAILDLERISSLSPCNTMPRLLYGSLENVTCRDATVANQLGRLPGFDFSEMSTLRFTQHSRKGDFAMSKFGKVLMDVSELSNETVATKLPRNVHRPYKPECGPGVAAFDEAVFIVNHYIGSWERYSSRTDARRSRHEWEKRAFLTNGNSCDQKVFEWFPRFVQQVGLARSKFLLGWDRDLIQPGWTQ